MVMINGIRNHNRETDFKEIDPIPMLVPLSDNKVKVKVGHPVFLNIYDEGDTYKVEIGIPEYGAFIKFRKTGGS